MLQNDSCLIHIVGPIGYLLYQFVSAFKLKVNMEETDYQQIRKNVIYFQANENLGSLLYKVLG